MTAQTRDQFEIVPKLDFGGRPFLIDGRLVSSGFVVLGPSKLLGGVKCNVMPGACWFETESEAEVGIARYIAVNGDAEKFWAAYRGDHAGVAQ